MADVLLQAISAQFCVGDDTKVRDESCKDF